MRDISPSVGALSGWVDDEINAFGAYIPPLTTIAEHLSRSNYLPAVLKSVIEHAGAAPRDSERIVDRLLQILFRSRNSYDYESAAHQFLGDAGLVIKFAEALVGRSQLIAKQILPHIDPGIHKILDCGCGDGIVGKLLAERRLDINLCDVYRHRNIAELNLPFHLLDQNEDLPFESNSFDAVLLLTVLHHSNNPLSLVEHATRVLKPRGSLLVIESVYGLSGEERELSSGTESDRFVQLSPEEQRYSNIFFDHFYNRVVHYSEILSQKVNVPFNFNTPKVWAGVFSRNQLVQRKVVFLGVDQPVVPEYHTLHVATKL